MQRTLGVCVALIAALGSVPAHSASNTDETAIRATIDLLMDAFHSADAKKLDQALHADARLVTLRDTEGGGTEVQIDTREHLMGTLGKIKPGDWDDRLDHVSVTVHKSGIAQAWAHYNFYIQGKHTHCGMESFQLYKQDGAWRIVNFADTHIWDKDNKGPGDKCS